MRQCYPAICAWTGDYVNNAHSQSINKPHCLLTQVLKLLFGELNKSLLEWCDYWLYFGRLIRPTQGDEILRRETTDYLEDHAVGTSDGILRYVQCTSPMTIIIFDILDTVYVAMPRHMIDWVMSVLQQHCRIDKFNQHYMIMPSYTGMTRFNKLYSQATKSSCNMTKALRHAIPSAFLATP
jgi:hypothetical protein